MSETLENQLRDERNLCDELAAALGGKADPVRALRRYAETLSDFKDKVEVIRYSEMHVGGWRSILNLADDDLEAAESMAHGTLADLISDARARICAAKIAKLESDEKK